MLRGIAAATSSASAAPIPVRQAQAAAASANAGTQTNAVVAVEAPAPQGTLAVAPQEFRFNSTEFVYRQDIGRIILIGQSPVTGERKIQIPSEEALRAYERTIKAEEQRSLLAAPTQVEPSPAPTPETQCGAGPHAEGIACAQPGASVDGCAGRRSRRSIGERVGLGTGITGSTSRPRGAFFHARCWTATGPMTGLRRLRFTAPRWL